MNEPDPTASLRAKHGPKLKSPDEFAQTTERFIAKRNALIVASKVEEQKAFLNRGLAILVLAASVGALWLLGALTVKSLVLSVVGAFVLKKFGDYRHNVWTDAKIREIEERFPRL